MKKRTLLISVVAVSALLFTVLIAGFASVGNPGEESLTRYEREHIRAIEDQTRAIDNLTREVKRIADNLR